MVDEWNFRWHQPICQYCCSSSFGQKHYLSQWLKLHQPKLLLLKILFLYLYCRQPQYRWYFRISGPAGGWNWNRFPKRRKTGVSHPPSSGKYRRGRRLCKGTGRSWKNRLWLDPDHWWWCHDRSRLYRTASESHLKDKLSGIFRYSNHCRIHWHHPPAFH